MKASRTKETKTGGRQASTRHIPPIRALAVGMPNTSPPKGWTWAALTDIARMESGHTPSRRHPEYWGGDVCWISIPDARDHHGRTIARTREQTNDLGLANSSARLLPPGTVCLSRTASVGYVTVMGCPMATSQDFVNWVCSDLILPRFLQYLLLAEGEDLLRFASGSVHQTIYYPEAKAFHVCYPPLPEQRRIVAILDEAFEGIAAAKANAERNLRNAKEVFESHRDTTFLELWQGEDCQHLEALVEEIATGPFGSLLHKSDYAEGGIPLVNPINIDEEAIVADARKAVSPATAKRLARYRLKAGDVAVGRRGDIGRCAVVAPEQAGWLCGTGCFVVRTGNAMVPEFLAHLLRSGPYRNQLVAKADRATMPSISNKDLARLPVPAIDPKRQRQALDGFAELSDHCTELAEGISRKLAALDELKASLLHQAFTGQL